MLPARLQRLRRARGLSLEALAAQMGGMVTKQALSKYETGKAVPSAMVLNQLASVLNVKAAYFFAPQDYEIRFIAYRKRASLTMKEQQHVESLVEHALEKRVRLQQLLGQGLAADVPVQFFHVNSLEDAEDAAEQLRSRWELGVEPIANVTHMLEDRLVHVVEVDAHEHFDGISAVVSDDEHATIAAAVVTQHGRPGERQRLSLAHELGHLVLAVDEGVDVEKAAFRFAGALLAPADVLRHAFGTKRSVLDLEELLLAKQHWGLSLQAILHRLHDLEIIDDGYYKQWCIRINKFGWRKQEPAELPSESPQWQRQHVLRLVAEGVMSAGEATDMLGEPVDARPSLSLTQRRAFLQLPIEARRRILAQQADDIADTYEPDADWKEFQAGDFIDDELTPARRDLAG
jgi:Zn-dependent peptidase ImmA (M78 family)/DNA-binding XRE family transcriptional regulator